AMAVDVDATDTSTAFCDYADAITNADPVQSSEYYWLERYQEALTKLGQIDNGEHRKQEVAIRLRHSTIIDVSPDTLSYCAAMCGRSAEEVAATIRKHADTARTKMKKTAFTRADEVKFRATRALHRETQRKLADNSRSLSTRDLAYEDIEALEEAGKKMKQKDVEAMELPDKNSRLRKLKKTHILLSWRIRDCEKKLKRYKDKRDKSIRPLEFRVIGELLKLSENGATSTVNRGQVRLKAMMFRSA
ncbi:hypothetical protein ACFL6M_03655, partial [Candidatus Eisenbacteria bacterium]